MKTYFSIEQCSNLIQNTGIRMTAKFVLLVCFVPLLFYQCTKDSIADITKPNDGNAITNRTCEPGDFIIDDGRIVFEDRADYQQTLDFLSCATPEEIEDWSGDITIETAGKSYREFWDLMCDEELTESEYEELKGDYEGKVIFTTNLDGDDEFAPLFPVLEELCNLNGEFQVETTVFKITEDNFVSIVDPEVTNPSEVDNDTETDSTKGVFVRPLRAGGCCANPDQEINQYINTHPRRRLVADYRVLDVSEVYEDYLHPGDYIFIPVLTAVAVSKSQIRRCFIFICTWNCNRVTLTQNFDIEFSHNADAWGVDDPVIFSVDQGPTSNTCRHTFQAFAGGDVWQLHAINIPEFFSICVEDVDQICRNSSPTTPVTAEIHCPF